ncbi:SH3 domain-containing protein [Ruminococcus flavefaciens]|uniref:SH3 domain-containing protein n=1 Tax=Ruminococcus flavefaciens TaxID=1265 RepID=UPI00048F32DC|nr:SH3 domain-containing protein [Ruminococcus flavefaciens]
MKNNIIKRTVCAALAAVSLSACVAVPSALNTTGSKLSLVNSIEAEAAFSPFYATATVTGTSLRDRPNGTNIARLWAFTPMYVTDETRTGRNYWYKVKTPYGEGWVNGRYVDRCTSDEYVFRSKFLNGKKTAFVMERKGVDCREKPSMDSKSTGNYWFMRTVDIDRIEPVGRDGIVWGHLANGRGYIPLNDGKGRIHCDLMSKEEANRMKQYY